MGRLIYKKSVKTVLVFLQGLAAFVLAVCILNIQFWMEGSFDLAELSRRYEESDMFFRQVDLILGHKIRGQDNSSLFEMDGEPDMQRQIDIQSYGTAGSSVQDMNTTYLLGDLLSFAENGGRKRLHEAITEAQGSSGGVEPGELLDGQSDVLETILPVTGISLSECSRWYSDSSGFLLEMYTALDEVSADIYSRYQEYTTRQEESWSAAAPSNLLYCIEDSASGTLYTNTGADTYEAAVLAAEAEEGFEALYEGERSFNIMVTNPEHILNSAAAEWFAQERFVGTNERVYLAVNLQFPVSDELRSEADYYARRESIVYGAGILAVLCLFVLTVCLALSLLGAGWEEGRCTPRLLRVDQVPVELAAGVYLIFAILYLMFSGVLSSTPLKLSAGKAVFCGCYGASVWLLTLTGLQSLVRRIRSKTLRRNSITWMLLRTWRQVTSARTAAGQLLLLYIGFFVLNFLFLLLFGRTGLVLVVVLDMAVLLYLLRDIAGKQSIYKGIHQISRGDLQYRIDVSSLQGETYEMARAVNEMGDSLCEAVEAIVKNERLKAELITNVSHDLKTPLTSIVNYVDLLKRENLQGEKVRHYIEVLDQKSQRLRQLTEDLVEASKISSGNIELTMVRMQLQSMLLQAGGEFEERLEEKKLKLVWKLEKEPAFILADGRQLWRILENLLGNIYKYAKEGTDVTVEEYRENRDAVFVLRNISSQEITVEADELTGRFVRGDRSRSTEGSGLGLSIAQNLAELMGGSLRLQLQGEEFAAVVRFPLAGPEDPA